PPDDAQRLRRFEDGGRDTGLTAHDERLVPLESRDQLGLGQGWCLLDGELRHAAQNLEPLAREPVEDQDPALHARSRAARRAAPAAAPALPRRPDRPSTSPRPVRQSTMSSSVTGPTWAPRKILPLR